MKIIFDKISRKPYYFFDGKFHDIDTYKTYYIAGVWDNPLIPRFTDVYIDDARVKSQLVFVITIKGWIVYGHYGNFVYKLALSSPDANIDRIVDVIPFRPDELHRIKERETLDVEYEQLVKLKLQFDAPLFITFQEIARKLSQGKIVRYQEEPELIGLSNTGNPIMSFVENPWNKYIVEVRIENGTIYPV